MENNEQTPEQKNPSGEGNGSKRRHRGHRGGRNHQNAKKRAENANVQENQGAPESEKAPKPEQNRDNNRDNNRGNQKHRHGYFMKPVEKGIASPYDKLPDEELSLSDWRAKIVLRSADDAKAAETPKEDTRPAVPAEPQAVEEPPKAAPEPAYPDLMIPAPDVPTPVEDNSPKVEVIGVRFRSSGKMYYFDPKGIKVANGADVIVETARGPEYGQVCLANKSVSEKDTVMPLRPMLRVATPADAAHNEENHEKEKKALVLCAERVEAHKLDMKLIEAQYAFDNSKLLFYFSSEGRVDFRELVKDLAALFHTRIELRQIGIRDEAKMLGGIGVCGRALCCSTFLPDFAQVTIKMAKEQNLSLNSAKISGVCGRLMCCLHYESETYADEIRRTPPVDSVVKTEDGNGVVISTNPLAGTVRVVIQEGSDSTVKQYHRDNVTVIGKEKHAGHGENDAEKSQSDRKK